MNWPRLASVIRRIQPQAIVNCIGIVKQRHEAKAAIPSIEVNALLPHRLVELGAELGATVIHRVRTVCSPAEGLVRRNRRARSAGSLRAIEAAWRDRRPAGIDASDVDCGTGALGKTGLIEWFLAQHGTIRGFRRAIYTGLTTSEMSRLIERLATRHAGLYGVWHVASRPITKYDLLFEAVGKLGCGDVTILPDDDFACDRSLCSERFRAATGGHEPPAWSEMLAELAEATLRRGLAARRG